MAQTLVENKPANPYEGKSEINGAAPPIQEWPNAPTYMTLKADFEAAKPSHDTAIEKINDWRSAMKVEDKYKPKPVTNRSSVQPKLIRKQAEWRYSALSEPFLGSDKLYDLRASTAVNIEPSKQAQLLLNWQFRVKIDKVKFIDDFVRSAVNDGTVIVRTGWERTMGEIEQEQPVYSFYETNDPADIELIEQAMQMLQENPDSASELDPAVVEAANYSIEVGYFCTAEQTGTETIKVPAAIVNKPTVDILNPDNVYIDPSANGDIDKANFAVIAFETSKSELEAQSDTYKNLKYVNWAGNVPSNNQDHKSGYSDKAFNFKDEARMRVIAFEYWGKYDINKDGALVPIVATWIGDTLIRMELNPFPDQKIPLVIAQYMPVVRSAYGEADAELLKENQSILGALTRGAVDLLGRSANSQTGIPVDYLDAYNMRLFEQGNNYTYNPNADIQGTGIIEHKYPELPQSALAMMGLQNQEAESMTGVKSFAGGVSGESYGNVAAGIRGALDAASKREMGILRRLANGIKEIGKKIISMNQEFMSEEETVSITSDTFQVIQRADIQGDFELIVDISTAEIDAKKSQELAFMLQTMGPNLPFEFTQMILVEIATLQRMPDLAVMIKEYTPEPDPAEEEMKQLAIKKAKTEIRLIESEIAINEAKAREIEAKIDKTVVDTQHDVDGTKHNRDMEKQRGQAEGNQDYKITDALTRPRKEGEAPVDPTAAIGFNEISRQRAAAQNSPNVSSILERNLAANQNPEMNLGSQSFDPSLDPAMNSRVRI